MPSSGNQPCAGGCGLRARKDGSYHPWHHPDNGGCPPRRVCACGFCGQDFQPGRPGTKFIKGHHNRTADKHCTKCGADVPKKNRSGLCVQCYHATLGGPMAPLKKWARDNDATYRATSSRNGRQGWKKQGVDRARVVAALRSKGLKTEDVARDLHISREYARALLNVGKHKYMRREMAERLLRYAAGLPFSPTKQQRVAAERKEMSWRRARERAGKSNAQPSIISPGIGRDLEASKHLAKKRSSMKII